MQDNDLSHIFTPLQAAAEEEAALGPEAVPALKPVQFLFLLGTDTVFTAGPTAPVTRYYERGETLSYSAQVLSHLLDEAAEIAEDKSAPLSYQSDSVYLLNGPTTRGTEVGERIAQALFLVLLSAARGKTDLMIAAHSRGAAESLLLMHEIERVKTELNEHPEKSLFDILHNSPCGMTKAAVIKLLKNPEEDTQELRTRLHAKLEAFNIFAFLIDPVPGGTIARIPGVEWSDKRFYQTPPCDDALIAICRDERTSCFYPVIPPGVAKINVPGHHGSASGNFYDQQFSDGSNGEGSHFVQQLILQQLFAFIGQKSLLPRLDRETALSLNHPELDPMLSTFLNSDDRVRNELILYVYRAIARHDNTYKLGSAVFSS